VSAFPASPAERKDNPMTIARHHRTPIMHRVVEHNGILYLGGMVAEDKSLPMGGQTEQALARIGALLEQHGSGKSKVLSATVFVTDLKQKPAMDAAWTAFFGDDLPTRATVGVNELGPGTLVEIVVTAATR
jgi:enamine deaminase RidA (YjgF/YER057c/UK114 family)